VNDLPDQRLLARRYGDKDVARILKRATELQRAEPGVADPDGLTLAELSEIAAEAGIDPSFLQRAAAEVSTRTPATSIIEQLTGAPMSVSVERVVPGELRPDQLDGIIPLIQQATDGQGTASAVGKTLTWSSRTDSNASAQQVLVASRDGTTLIRIEETFTGLAGGLFGGIVGGVGVGGGIGFGGAMAGVAGSVALAFALPITIIGGSYLAARTIFMRVVRKHESAAVGLGDQIAEYVRVEGNLTETTAELSGSDPDLHRIEG